MAVSTILVSCADRDHVSDAQYRVVRIDVIQGKPGNNDPPAPFKVAFVNGFKPRTRMLIEEGNFSNCEHLPPSCGHETVKNERIAIEDWGYIDLDDWTLAKLKLGQAHHLTTDNFGLRNVLSYYTQASFYKIDDTRPVKLKITLLKQCQAEIASVEDSVVKFNSGGIISIPVFKKIYWTELKADCMEQADMQLSIQ
jgi:hypothetical protein